MSKQQTIEQQLAALLKGATTTPEQWAAAYDKAQEARARGERNASDATFTMFAKFGELSAAQGWTDGDSEAMDEVLALRGINENDKSVASRLRCAASPYVRDNLKASWHVAEESLPRFKDLPGTTRRLSLFYSINTALRKAEGKITPEQAAESVYKDRVEKAYEKSKPTTTASDFKRSRANECKEGYERNEHKLAALFTAESWARYCDAVAGLTIAVGQTAKPEAPEVDSESTDEGQATPDIGALFDALGLDATQKQAMAALLSK